MTRFVIPERYAMLLRDGQAEELFALLEEWEEDTIAFVRSVHLDIRSVEAVRLQAHLRATIEAFMMCQLMRPIDRGEAAVVAILEALGRVAFSQSTTPADVAEVSRKMAERFTMIGEAWAEINRQEQRK